MAESVNWLTVLNEQAEWRDQADMLCWLAKLAGRPLHPSKPCLNEFQATLGFIRCQASAFHFDEPVALPALNERLQGISLKLVPGQPDEQNSLLCMPLLQASRRGSSDEDFVRSLEQTLLFQFAVFLSQAAQGSADAGLARCEGIYREPALNQAAQEPADQLEERWRSEIPVLVSRGLTSTNEIQRCSDFFLARPKSRFCSETCRFTTFQLTKQLTDPGYLADKQRRYRKRREQ